MDEYAVRSHLALAKAIDEQRMDEVTPIYEQALPVFDMPLVEIPTFYRRVGNWFGALCLIASIVLLRPRRSKQ